MSEDLGQFTMFVRFAPDEKRRQNEERKYLQSPPIYDDIASRDWNEQDREILVVRILRECIKELQTLQVRSDLTSTGERNWSKTYAQTSRVDIRTYSYTPYAYCKG